MRRRHVLAVVLGLLSVLAATPSAQADSRGRADVRLNELVFTTK